MDCNVQRLQTWLEGRKRQMFTHVSVETEPEKLVKEENVPKDRSPSKKEAAAVRRGTCQTWDLPPAKGSHYHAFWLVYLHKSSYFTRCAEDCRHGFHFLHAFCRHTATLSLGIWMSACLVLCAYFSCGNRSTGFTHGKNWINSFAGAILMYS